MAMLGCGARVLIVDDNASVRTALYRLMSLQPGLDPIGVAESGEQACLSAAADPPDVILMDVQMPGMDGIEATRWITSHVPSTRIIGMSAADELIVGVPMRAAGAVDFVSKIDGMHRVVEAVQTAANEPARANSAAER
jgi:DNA-binding NarL/FixJ family response regulator